MWHKIKLELKSNLENIRFGLFNFSHSIIHLAQKLKIR